MAFKVDYVQPIVHKYSQCADNSSYRIGLPQVWCAGVTHTRAHLDSPSPLRIVISSFQPPRINYARRRCNSRMLNSRNELVHKYSGIKKSCFQSLVKTAMLMSNPWRAYDILYIGNNLPATSSTSWDASRSAASCTVYVAFSHVFVETLTKIVSLFSKAPRSMWRCS